MFYSFRLAGGIWELRRIRLSGEHRLAEEWSVRFREICRGLGITRSIHLVASSSVSTPIAIGIIKPLIIVPAGLFLQMDPRQLESVIAHELIHIRRHDPLINLIQTVAEAVFFYHPALWWISAQIRREREFAADAAVIGAFSGDTLVYARALANLEEIRLLADMDALPSVATAANGGNLMKRIHRILNKKTEITHANSAWSAGMACLLISAVLLTLLSFTPQSLVNAQKRGSERSLAIGFVSIPPTDRTAFAPKDADATTRLIIAKLKHHKVPALGFVTGGQIWDGEKFYPVRANMVRMWSEAGLEVGIGNFRHIWFYQTPYDDYVSGVEKNEAVVRKLLGEKSGQLRYFSYPYLNTGKNAADRDKFEQWLSARGLRSVKYTIDNQEWMYSYAYDMARIDNDLNTMNEIRVSFLRYMDRMFDHYEGYSQQLFGRDIPQTMVLTPSRLVADTADEFFGMIRKRGYRFVRMSDALSDEAYQMPENMFGNFGNSWMERWTHAQGRPLREEPAVDPLIEKTWKERDVKK
jgi:peptidoglycan/xylan/chitin deacetylase (PgdA/CDA1 family)